MDPLDPLTEIVNSGQGFFYLITLERILWSILGIFFIGVISQSIIKGMQNQGWFGNKSFLVGIKKENRDVILKKKNKEQEKLNTNK